MNLKLPEHIVPVKMEKWHLMVQGKIFVYCGPPARNRDFPCVREIPRAETCRRCYQAMTGCTSEQAREVCGDGLMEVER